MKKARTLFSLLVVLATVLTLLTMSGCNSSAGDPPKGTNYYQTVMIYKPFTNMPDITVEQVLEKYMDEPGGTYSGTKGKYSVVVNGTVPSLEQKVTFNFTVTDDPDDKTKCFIDIDSAKINDNELDSDTAVDYLYELFSAYNAGCEDLSQWQGSEQEQSSSTNNEPGISDVIIQMIEKEGFEWVEPLTVENGCITGVVRNVSGATKDASISFILYDKSGYQIDTTSDYMSNIKNGGSWKFEAMIYDLDNEVKTYELEYFKTY